MQPNWIFGLAATTLAAILLCPLAGAHAATDETSVNEEILEILRRDGTIDQQRYDELKAKADAEEAEETAEAGSEKPAPEAFAVTYKDGLRFERNDGLVKVRLGGLIQADFATIHPDDDLDESMSGGNGEGTEFRRARLYMSGALYERAIFKAEYDFAPGSVSFADVYVGMTDLGRVLGTVRVGNFKESFGLEELTSDSNITFMERGLSNAFSSGRDFGIGFGSANASERITWSATLMANSNSQGMSFTHHANFNLDLRVTGLPCYEDDGERLVHLGFAVSEQFRDDDGLRYRERPEARLAKQYWDTGNVRTDGNTLLGVEAAWVQGPLSVQAEWKQSLSNITQEAKGMSSVGGKGTSYTGGGYIDASYFLTGEHRAYDKANGHFAAVSPLHPFNPAAGHWGAIQIAERLSYLDLNDSGLYGGKGYDLTTGINWYLYSNVRVTVNYVYAHVDTGPSLSSHGGDIHIAEARAQVVF